MRKQFKTKLSGLFAALLLLCSAAAGETLSTWVTPSKQWETFGPPSGTLLIAGGANSDSVYQSFMELLGDPGELIVFISTANDALDERNKAYGELVKHGATNIVLLHTHDRRVADSEAFVEPIRRAKAVYISGGYQKRLARMYLHTLTHKEIFNLLERGGIVGGSSAGASIQGDYLYGGGPDHTVGFALVRDSVISQHYVRRNRMGRVGKIVEENPHLFGFGIDEATAVVVRGNEMEVVGDSKVAIYDNKAANWSATEPQEYLFKGDRYDLARRTVVGRAHQPPQDIWSGAGQDWATLATAWNKNALEQGQLLFYGGDANEAALEHFLSSAGGKDAAIVVLSSGNNKLEDNQKIVDELKKLGATSVSLVHSIDRNEANSLSFTEPLRAAQAVWIGEGDLWRYADTYAQTLAHKELWDLLERGGTIAGSGVSSGILASRLYDAGYTWKNGYGLLEQVMVFEEPLKAAAAKSMKNILKRDDQLLGIGLGKGSRLVVRKGVAAVEGEGEVTFYGPGLEDKKVAQKVLRAGEVFPLVRSEAESVVAE